MGLLLVHLFVIVELVELEDGLLGLEVPGCEGALDDDEEVFAESFVVAVVLLVGHLTELGEEEED